MKRKLASIKRIDRIEPHENADRLEIAHVGGWPAVVAKGQFREGDIVVFCEVDTLLPPREEYAFLKKSCQHTEPDGTEWYRIKTAKLRGQLSQGLILSMDTFCRIASPVIPIVAGMDVTDMLGVRKYEKICPVELAGKRYGDFPFFIQRTDEERIQNIGDLDFLGRQYSVTEKLDGSSCTVYRFGDHVGVCSRNTQWVQSEDNVYWRTAEKLRLPFHVNGYPKPIALQGELVGPGIQGNPYKLQEHCIYIFNIWDIGDQQYWKSFDVRSFCVARQIPTVPCLGYYLPESREEVMSFANGQSCLNQDVTREGLVYVSDPGSRVSFKAISNRYLLKNS